MVFGLLIASRPAAPLHPTNRGTVLGTLSANWRGAIPVNGWISKKAALSAFFRLLSKYRDRGTCFHRNLHRVHG
jgi:hypothetical protein